MNPTAQPVGFVRSIATIVVAVAGEALRNALTGGSTLEGKLLFSGILHVVNETERTAVAI